MEWNHKEDIGGGEFSYAKFPHVAFEAEEYFLQRGKWSATVILHGMTLRAGNRSCEAFNSREEAETAAVDLMLKHISELAATIGYKVVKEQE